MSDPTKNVHCGSHGEQVATFVCQHLGHGGRIKLEASNEFGSVSAIPWYKAGFRPQPGARFHADTFDNAAAALQAAVEGKARMSAEQGRQFDGLLMFLDKKT